MKLRKIKIKNLEIFKKNYETEINTRLKKVLTTKKRKKKKKIDDMITNIYNQTK